MYITIEKSTKEIVDITFYEKNWDRELFWVVEVESVPPEWRMRFKSDTITQEGTILTLAALIIIRRRLTRKKRNILLSKAAVLLDADSPLSTLQKSQLRTWIAALHDMDMTDPDVTFPDAPAFVQNYLD